MIRFLLQKPWFDRVVWAMVVLFVLLGLSLNYHFDHVAIAVRLSAWIVLTLVSAAIVSQTRAGRLFVNFLKDVRVELRKVVWSSRQETIRMTGLVTIVIIIAALLLWAIDSALLWIVNLLTG